MSEYIVNMGDTSEALFSVLARLSMVSGCAEVREEITRCRDCCRRREWTPTEKAGYGEAQYADAWCTFIRIGVDDDWYCRWGEKFCPHGERRDYCPVCGSEMGGDA